MVNIQLSKPEKICNANLTFKILLVVGLSLPTFVMATPKIFSLNNDGNSEVISVFDCQPSLSGKVALGDNQFAYVWECENKTNPKYSIYTTSYTSRFNFNLKSKYEATDFFTIYLANKVTSLSQNNRMSNLKYNIFTTNYTSKEYAYADYLITYNWDIDSRMSRQGRFIFKNGYIADWSVTSLMESGEAADKFNSFVKIFKIKTR